MSIVGDVLVLVKEKMGDESVWEMAEKVLLEQFSDRTVWMKKSLVLAAYAVVFADLAEYRRTGDPTWIADIKDYNKKKLTEEAEALFGELKKFLADSCH